MEDIRAMSNAQFTQIIFLSKYSDEEICHMVDNLSLDQRRVYDEEFDEFGIRGALFIARSYPEIIEEQTARIMRKEKKV